MGFAIIIIAFLGGIFSIISILTRLIRKKGLKIKTSGIILLASMILFFIGAMIGGSDVEAEKDKITLEDLNKYAQQQKYDELIYYIEYYDDRKADEKIELVNQAVHLIVDNESKEQMDKLEAIFFSTEEAKEDYIYLSILQDFNKDQKTFKEPDKAYAWYVNNDKTQAIDEEMVKMLNNYEKDKINTYFSNQLKTAYENGDIDTALKIVEKSSVFGLEYDFKMLNKKLGMLKAQEEKASELREKAGSLVGQIEELTKDAPNVDIINLHAYMVYQHDSGYYEIAFLENSGFGEVPSEEHALLKTVDTEFKSKGTFDMLVYESGEEEIELTEEAGAFTQTWKVYKEVPLSTMEKKNEIQKLQGQLRLLEEDINSIEGQIDGLRADIGTVIGK